VVTTKAYCPKCKKLLSQVLSSFECLSTWDKVEEYYAPEDECKLLKRCPACGTLVEEKDKKIRKPIKKQMGEKDVRPSHFRKRLKEPRVEGEDLYGIQS
jgi:hypothetical protein